MQGRRRLSRGKHAGKRGASKRGDERDRHCRRLAALWEDRRLQECNSGAAVDARDLGGVVAGRQCDDQRGILALIGKGKGADVIGDALDGGIACYPGIVVSHEAVLVEAAKAGVAQGSGDAKSGESGTDGADEQSFRHGAVDHEAGDQGIGISLYVAAEGPIGALGILGGMAGGSEALETSAQ
jgi:hypothetical protein